MDHWEEVEGWLSLGATPREATLDIARGAIREELIPSTDQTKTTGVVTLPGGVRWCDFRRRLPVEAGLFQIVELAGIMAAEKILKHHRVVDLLVFRPK